MPLPLPSSGKLTTFPMLTGEVSPLPPPSSGKTTIFRMLTGEVAPSRGDVRVCGTSASQSLWAMWASRRHLGYCPQFEALPGAMTGREVLHMYARWAVGASHGYLEGRGCLGGRATLGVVLPRGSWLPREERERERKN